MLPAAHRMRRSETFRTVVRSGVRAGRRHLVVHLLLPSQPGQQPGVQERDDAAHEPGPTQVGLVVSRAVGAAAVRTTVKRRLRHLATARLATLPPGCALVVRATPAAAGRPSAVLGADLDAALASARRTAASGRVAPGAGAGAR